MNVVIFQVFIEYSECDISALIGDFRDYVRLFCNYLGARGEHHGTHNRQFNVRNGRDAVQRTTRMER